MLNKFKHVLEGRGVFPCTASSKLHTFERVQGDWARAGGGASGPYMQRSNVS